MESVWDASKVFQPYSHLYGFVWSRTRKKIVTNLLLMESSKWFLEHWFKENIIWKHFSLMPHYPDPFISNLCNLQYAWVVRGVGQERSSQAARGAHLVTGAVCQERAGEAAISYSPSKRKCPYSSKKQSEKVNTFLFSTKTTQWDSNISVSNNYYEWQRSQLLSSVENETEFFYSWWWFFYSIRAVNSQLPHSASHQLLLPSYPGNPIKSSNFLF